MDLEIAWCGAHGYIEWYRVCRCVSDFLETTHDFSAVYERYWSIGFYEKCDLFNTLTSIFLYGCLHRCEHLSQREFAVGSSCWGSATCIGLGWDGNYCSRAPAQSFLDLQMSGGIVTWRYCLRGVDRGPACSQIGTFSPFLEVHHSVHDCVKVF